MTDRTKPRQTNNSTLAQLRRERGLTQSQLAEKIGCYAKDISRWETGNHRPGTPYLIKLADTLGCTIDSLLQ